MRAAERLQRLEHMLIGFLHHQIFGVLFRELDKARLGVEEAALLHLHITVERITDHGYRLDLRHIAADLDTRNGSAAKCYYSEHSRQNLR